jgi:hypothetical protein
MELIGRYTLLHLTLIILHIATAAAWFGLGLRLAGQARKVLEIELPAARALAADIGRSVSQMNILIVLTFIFSLAAFFVGGGFAVYGPAYHTSITLIVLMVIGQFVLIRSGWKTLRTTLENAGPDVGPDPSIADGARKRVAIGTGIGHLLWLVILVLMFWDHILGAVTATALPLFL